MRVDVSACGREHVPVSLTDAFSVCGALGVMMWSRLDVGRRVDVMRVDVSVCGRKRVVVCLSDAVSVCGALGVVM